MLPLGTNLDNPKFAIVNVVVVVNYIIRGKDSFFQQWES